jgi:hypothetical protein
VGHEQPVKLRPELLAPGAGRVPLGGPVPQRPAGQLGDDGRQPAPGRARPERDVEVGQPDPGQAGRLCPAEETREAVRAVIVDLPP